MHVQTTADQISVVSFFAAGGCCGQRIAVAADLHEFSSADHGPQPRFQLAPVRAAQSHLPQKLSITRSLARLPLDVAEDLNVIYQGKLLEMNQSRWQA
jgi:hypothetical protein